MAARSMARISSPPLLLGLLFATAAAAAPARAAPAAPVNVSSVYNTFYGARDNCPPGGDIAHPGLHRRAGGTGTFADPITFAGYAPYTPPGTVIYSWRLRRYFVMEDDCEECASDYKKHGRVHFDCWIGPDAVTPGPNLIACEDALTADGTVFEVNAAAGHPVDAAPLFNGTSLACAVPAPPCTDKGHACGNECQVPKAGTCAAVAAELLLPLPRFEALNPKLNATCAGGGVIKKGESVCMGGTCGD
jgi:hypothetical protein